MKIKESSCLTIKFFGRVHRSLRERPRKVPNVNSLVHRRTRRGGRPPLAWKFSGQAQVAQKSRMV